MGDTSAISACECLLACDVFKGNTSKCSTSGQIATMAVDQRVSLGLQRPGTECAGMACLVRCAHQLKCLDEPVLRRCNRVRDMNSCLDLSCGPRKQDEQEGAAAIGKELWHNADHTLKSW